MTAASYENCEKILNIIREKTNKAPKIGIVCGSGLGKIGEFITDAVYFSYADLPGFHVSKVAGHKSRLILGKLNGVEVVCMQGRFHGYEGIPYNTCAFPIRVMKLLGVEYCLVTNAAGAINKNYKLGDFMILKDHLPVAMWGCNNPLVGPNESKFGDRFFPTNNMFPRDMMDLVQECAKELGQSDTIQEGVYAMMGGPNYESIAELKALEVWGADVAGMSTSPEVMVAHHCGIKCVGITMVTNLCVMDYDDHSTPNHAEVIEMADRRAADMVEIAKKLVVKLDQKQ